MATINTFNVTPADISGQVHNLSINPTSSPNTTQVENMINLAASIVASEADAAGIDVSGLDSTSSTYYLLANAVINKVVADLLVGRNRGDAAAGAYYLENFKIAIDTLRRYPQRVQTNPNAGPDLAEYVEQSAADLADIPWYGSMAGKIFQGGM
jgi:hypothetical protein